MILFYTLHSPSSSCQHLKQMALFVSLPLPVASSGKPTVWTMPACCERCYSRAPASTRVELPHSSSAPWRMNEPLAWRLASREMHLHNHSNSCLPLVCKCLAAAERVFLGALFWQQKHKAVSEKKKQLAGKSWPWKV